MWALGAVLLLVILFSLISISEVYASQSFGENTNYLQTSSLTVDWIEMMPLVMDNNIHESFSNYLFILLAPLSAFILFRSDKEKMLEFGSLNVTARQFFSLCLILILISPFGVMPFYASSYWGLAFAEEMNNQTSTEDSSPVTNATEPLPANATEQGLEHALRIRDRTPACCLEVSEHRGHGVGCADALKCFKCVTLDVAVAVVQCRHQGRDGGRRAEAPQ